MKAQFKHVVHGKKLYKVYGFGNRSFIETLKIINQPYELNIGFPPVEIKEWFCDCQSDHCTKHFSLRDAGIVENTYNAHQTFTTLKEAKEYMKAQEVI